MSLIDDIEKSPKVSAQLIVNLDDAKGEPEDKICLTIIFRSSAALPLKNRHILSASGDEVKGVEVNPVAGTIYTGRASIEGVKALVDDARITSVNGSSQLRPI